jgi:hypothetical protein
MARLLTSTFLLTLTTAASGCHQSAPAANADDHVRVHKNGETTTVVIDDESKEPESPLCKRYCERLSACWYAVPNADPMLAKKDVYARCWAEQQDCKTVPTEMMCCGSLTECGDFVRCQASSADIVSDCRHPASGATAHGASPAPAAAQ